MPVTTEFVDVASVPSPVQVRYTPAATGFTYKAPASGTTVLLQAQSAYSVSVNGVVLGRLLRSHDLWLVECVKPVGNGYLPPEPQLRGGSASRKDAAGRLVAAVIEQHPDLSAQAGL